MKKLILFLAIALSNYCTYAQNVFPTPSGNVGIGTTSPATLLDVNGSFYLNRPIIMRDPGNTLGASSFIKIVPTSMSATNASYLNLGFPNNNTVGLYTDYDGNILTGGVSFRDIQFGRINAPYFTVKDGGNIGIGTTSPGYKIDAFNADATLYSPSTANATLRVYNPSATDGVFSGVEFAGQDGSSEYASTRIGSVIKSGYNADFIIQQRNAGIYQENLRVTASGNVLIGQTTQVNPAYKLDVKGRTRADEIVVNTSGADFVFDKKYTLPKLLDVKAYIDKNQHLPEIPSAKEMQTNGMSVGEINTKLLQKVEELTLYLIEKDKEIKAQEKRIENLEKRRHSRSKNNHILN